MPNEPNEPWYGIRCIFDHGSLEEDETFKRYEERIVMFKADSPETAIALAEQEATQYAEDVSATYTGLCQVFHLYDAEVASGVEVFSLMRDSKLNESEYLDHFFDTKLERTK